MSRMTFENVVLRPLETQDLDALFRWYTDPELMRDTGGNPHHDYEPFIERHTKRIQNPTPGHQPFLIEVDGRPAGLAELALIDREQQRAAVSIFLGEKSLWGRGLAPKALKLLLGYGFRSLDLQRLYAEVYGFNVRSQRLMEKVGFVKEGVLRRHEMHEGVLQDMHFYGLLRSEFVD